MQDLEIVLDHRPGALAEMGEALGRAGVSVEGGGGFAIERHGVMHFLFEDGDAACIALEHAGITVNAVRDVIAVRLKQDQPGQLGEIARRMAHAGVNIEAVYSDHDHRLILVVDHAANAAAVAAEWTRASAGAVA